MAKNSTLKRNRRLTIPVSEIEHAEIDRLARFCGYSTQSFTRLLFSFAISNIEEIVKHIGALRQKGSV